MLLPRKRSHSFFGAVPFLKFPGKERCSLIAIIDYGAGNLFSVQNALSYLDILHQVTDDPQVIERANGIILPGVGAFPDAMNKLGDRRLFRYYEKRRRKSLFLESAWVCRCCFPWDMNFRRWKAWVFCQARWRESRAVDWKSLIWDGIVCISALVARCWRMYQKGSMYILSIPFRLSPKRTFGCLGGLWCGNTCPGMERAGVRMSVPSGKKCRYRPAYLKKFRRSV